MASKKRRAKKPRLAELRTDIAEDDFRALEAGGFLPVLRWVKFGKSKLYRTHEALRALLKESNGE